MSRDLRTLDADIRALHAAYVRASGLDVELTMTRLATWEPLWAKGVTPADVVLVVAHVKGKARRQLPARQLTFRTFIGMSEAFEEDLAEARAANRVRRPEPGRAEVLQATGRPAAATPQGNGRVDAAPVPPAPTVGQVMLSSTEIQEALKRCREEL